jgi:hypothetical protein
MFWLRQAFISCYSAIFFKLLWIYYWIRLAIFMSFLDGPGSSISVDPTNASITKVLGQRLRYIGCSAQCNPSCQFHWIKPDWTVVDGSNIEIQSLSKIDHGTFTCQTGNGYGSNATKNLLVTVNCKYLKFNTIVLLNMKRSCLPFTLEYLPKTRFSFNDYCP